MYNYYRIVLSMDHELPIEKKVLPNYYIALLGLVVFSVYGFFVYENLFQETPELVDTTFETILEGREIQVSLPSGEIMTASKENQEIVIENLPIPEPTGVCGPAHATESKGAPSENLCEVGDIQNLHGTGPWFWSCGYESEDSSTRPAVCFALSDAD